MKFKTFIGNIVTRVADYETKVQYLFVANSLASAENLLKAQAALFYGDGDQPEEDSGYYSNNGEVHVRPDTLKEIGLAVFLELKSVLPVRKDANVPMPSEADLSDSVQGAAQALHSALVQKAPGLTHSAVLNALAASWGEKNWQVLRAKKQGPDPAALRQLLKGAALVCELADGDGGDPAYTVTSADGVRLLNAALPALAAYR